MSICRLEILSHGVCPPGAHSVVRESRWKAERMWKSCVQLPMPSLVVVWGRSRPGRETEDKMEAWRDGGICPRPPSWEIEVRFKPGQS
uniref:Uncharacterized protein n=1 Tax=Mustela putorius furo TaxID=9669 RepID=M3YFP3_MUSPF